MGKDGQLPCSGGACACPKEADHGRSLREPVCRPMQAAGGRAEVKPC